MSMDTGKTRGPRKDDIRWEGAGADSKRLFPQVCVCPTREEVTNG